MPRSARQSPRGKQGKREDVLDQLLAEADPDVARRLVKRLTAGRPDLRRESLNYLAGAIPRLPRSKLTAARADEALAVWAEVEPDLAELDTYGGADDATEQRVWDLLTDLAERLGERYPSPSTVAEDGPDAGEDDDDDEEGEPVILVQTRRAILNKVFPYLASRNSGAEDILIEVAYSTCHNDDDLRHLALRFRALNSPYMLDHAMSIYRDLGDREEYLSLRLKDLESGHDYMDLTTFYWESGEREKALTVAREGLAKTPRAEGRELRAFLAERAREAGNRAEYLDLQFAQAVDRLTPDSYTAFKGLCKPAEWAAYEPRLLAEVERAPASYGVEVRILRGEYDKALALLPRMAYKLDGDNPFVRAAAQLERIFPDKILAFYQSGLGNLNTAASRSEYRRRAHNLVKVRHMWLDVLKEPDTWTAFARRVKWMNQRRPACEEEFASIIPGWREL